jgi:hypothetical protein
MNFARTEISTLSKFIVIKFCLLPVWGSPAKTAGSSPVSTAISNNEKNNRISVRRASLPAILCTGAYFGAGGL